MLKDLAGDASGFLVQGLRFFIRLGLEIERQSGQGFRLLTGMVVFSLQGPAQACTLAKACARPVSGSQAMTRSVGGMLPVAGAGRLVERLVWLAFTLGVYGAGCRMDGGMGRLTDRSSFSPHQAALTTRRSAFVPAACLAMANLVLRDRFIAEWSFRQDVMVVAIPVPERNGQDPDGIDQLEDTPVEFGGYGHDWHSQQGFEAFQMQEVPPLLDFIHHVQGHNHGPAEFFQLQGQVQVALEIAGIDDVDDHVRQIFQDVVASDDFLDRIRGQRIDPGQIDQGKQIGSAPDHTDFFLDRHTGPIACRLARAREAVEQGCFAAVGVAGQCQVDVHRRSSRSISIMAASRLRMDRL